MAYPTAIAQALIDQLNSFATLGRYQLVGHLAILDFWLAEVRHALDLVDNYKPRFEKVRAAQKRYVAERETIRFDIDDPSSIQGTVVPPLRMPTAELRDARAHLCDALYRFLLRCYHEGVLDEVLLRDTCQSLEIRVDAADLQHR